MRRGAGFLVAAASLAVLFTAPAFCGSITVNNAASGYYNDSGFHSGAKQTYFSGNNLGNELKNLFVFDLIGVSGPISGASFSVYTYTINAPGTFTIYATDLAPTLTAACADCTDIYDGLSSGTAIGSIDLTTADMNQFVSINLDAGGRSWLMANEGSSIVLGGWYPQDPDDAVNTYAFGFSDFNRNNRLLITTAPEPGSYALFSLGLAGLAAHRRRRAKQK